MELSDEVRGWVHGWRDERPETPLDAADLRSRAAAWLKAEAAEKNDYLGKKRGNWLALFKAAVARHQKGDAKLDLAEESAWAVLCHERDLAPKLWLATEGPAFAVRAWMGTWAYDPWGHCHPHSDKLFARESHGEWRGLRDALRYTDDGAFAQATRVAKGDGAAYPITMRVALAYALAEGDWARELVPEWEAEAKAGTIPSYADAYGWGLLATASDGPTAEHLARALVKIDGYSRTSWHDMAATTLARIGEASLPALAVLLDGAAADRETPAGEVAKVVACMATRDAGRALAKHLEHKAVRPVLLAWVDAHPGLGVAVLAEVAASRSKAADSARRALSQTLRAHPGSGKDAAKLVSEQERALIDQSGAASAMAEASAKDLPPVLVSPPWLSARKAKPRPTASGLTVPKRPERVVWKPGERERAKDSGIDWDLLQNWNEVPKGAARGSAKVDAHVAKKVASANSASWSKRIHFIGTMLAGMSEKAALSLFNELEDIRKLDPSGYDIRKILGEFETKALPGLLRAAEAWPQTVLPELAHVDSPRVAMPMADALVRMKKVGPVARAWLSAFPETAAVALVPAALDGPPKSRDAAQSALRVLAEHGKRDVVLEVAATYGTKADAAVRDILAFDPLDDLPAKMPALPSWLDPATLPAPRVGTAKVLPSSAVGHLLTMLSISTLEAPYPGVAMVKAACDPRSLAELAWEVFLAWSLAGSPPKDDWALGALGLVGDDDCARRLAPRIREWPGEGGHARAVKGLDVLAAIGSDIALMHLDAIATKVKFKGLQEKARERISAVAEARGLTRDELADRLAPDLDLDEDGSRTLSFGARSFRVVWDEQLTPFVVDESKKRQKDLPKPGKTDDRTQAKDATAAWKALKKDAKAVASHQVMRLERAMCARRRWDATTFQTFFVMHPLVVHLVRRVVLGVYKGGKLGETFRVAEDRTFADVRDRPFTPTGGVIGIVHRLELDDALRTAWSELLGQYEIIPPFSQLDREIFTATAAEAKASSTKRFEGVAVPLGKVLGLEARGWRRGMPQDAGWIWDMQKPLGDGNVAVLGLGGGILAGDMRESPAEQKLEALTLEEEDTHKPGAKFSAIDPIIVSELLRDVAQLGNH